jgi:hypothetical protein
MARIKKKNLDFDDDEPISDLPDDDDTDDHEEPDDE